MAERGFEPPYPADLELLPRRWVESDKDQGFKSYERFVELVPKYKDETEDKEPLTPPEVQAMLDCTIDVHLGWTDDSEENLKFLTDREFDEFLQRLRDARAGL
jgi:hypothetical protein